MKYACYSRGAPLAKKIGGDGMFWGFLGGYVGTFTDVPVTNRAEWGDVLRGCGQLGFVVVCRGTMEEEGDWWLSLIHI